jgi:collagenase-like PrtC family protease
MSIGERINELNARLFALEGRMRAFEEVSEQDRIYRKEVHERLIKGQEDLTERLNKLAIKMAWYAGILAVLASLPAWGPFLQKLLVKGP